jgi:hypothetical protein
MRGTTFANSSRTGIAASCRVRPVPASSAEGSLWLTVPCPGRTGTYYAPLTSSSRPSSSQTSYKWAFAKNGVRVDSRALDSARAAVDSMTNAANPAAVAEASSSSRPRLGPAMGPSMGPSVMGSSMGPSVMGAQRPSEADRTYDRESRNERSRDEDKRERKRAREEEKEGRAGGREGRLEKRKEVNAGNRQMRDRSPGGLELDEGALLGGPTNEFQARCGRWNLPVTG